MKQKSKTTKVSTLPAIRSDAETREYVEAEAAAQDRTLANMTLCLLKLGIETHKKNMRVTK
jgi:hypothetical protein